MVNNLSIYKSNAIRNNQISHVHLTEMNANHSHIVNFF